MFEFFEIDLTAFFMVSMFLGVYIYYTLFILKGYIYFRLFYYFFLVLNSSSIFCCFLRWELKKYFRRRRMVLINVIMLLYVIYVYTIILTLFMPF